MSNWAYAQKVPTTAWRSAMTIPRELTLRKTGQDYRIVTRPAGELASMRGAASPLESMSVSGVVDLTDKLPNFAGLAEINVELALPDSTAGNVGIELSNSRGETYRIGFDAGGKQFFSDRTKSGDASFSDAFAAGIHTAPRLSQDGTLRLRLFVDVSSVELFADDGASVMTEIFFPSEPFTRIGIFSEGQGFRVLSGEIFPLSSAWD
jgi:sucrose-6-phosphate hydrolase SacC (GH32 family)